MYISSARTTKRNWQKNWVRDGTIRNDFGLHLREQTWGHLQSGCRRAVMRHIFFAPRRKASDAMPSSLSIRAFDPTSIKRENNGKIARKMAFIGGSGRRKSTGMMSVISYLAKEIDLVILMCPTETTRNIFRARGLPESLIYPGLDLECISALLAAQRANKERGNTKQTAKNTRASWTPIQNCSILFPIQSPTGAPKV